MTSYHGTVNKFLFLKYSRRPVNAVIQSGDNCITEEKLRKKKIQFKQWRLKSWRNRNGVLKEIIFTKLHDSWINTKHSINSQFVKNIISLFLGSVNPLLTTKISKSLNFRGFEHPHYQSKSIPPLWAYLSITQTVQPPSKKRLLPHLRKCQWRNSVGNDTGAPYRQRKRLWDEFKTAF